MTAGVIAASLWLLLRLSNPTAHPLAHAAPSDVSGCTATITRTVMPNRLRACESSGVGLELHPRCPGDPLNVVLVLEAYAGIEFVNQAPGDLSCFECLFSKAAHGGSART